MELERIMEGYLEYIEHYTAMVKAGEEMSDKDKEYKEGYLDAIADFEVSLRKNLNEYYKRKADNMQHTVKQAQEQAEQAKLMEKYKEQIAQQGLMPGIPQGYPQQGRPPMGRPGMPPYAPPGRPPMPGPKVVMGGR